MASSFITKDNKTGFWINDGLFQIVCGFISKVILSKQPNGWVVEIYNLFKDNSSGLFPGFMHLDFDVLNSDEKINFTIQAINEVRDQLIEKGEFISVKELNSFIVNEDLQGEWQSHLETHRVIQALESLRKVLQNEFNFQADNPWFEKL